MRRMIQRSLALAKKETWHLLRDRQALALAILMPLMLVLLFGYAVSFDASAIDVAIVDRDHTHESRDAVDALINAEVIRVVALLDDESGVEKLMLAGKIKGALVIPEGHARALARGDTADIQILLDGSDGTSAQSALGDALATLQARAESELGLSALGGLPIAPKVRTWFNPEMRSALFVVPGLVGVVLAILAVLLSALTVAREWERGSMEQLFATPVGRLEVVLGKLMPYVALGLLQLLLVLASGVWLFDVPFRGSFFLLLLATALFMICVLGQGFLISTITKSQQVATQLGALSAILPSLLLSGFLFPIQNMPLPLQLMSRVVPTRYLLPILRGVMLQGRGLEELWPSFVGLMILATAMVGVCTAKFKRSLD
ncbi:MAG: ABC transporter permease [Myxococcota bacterium]